MLTYVGDGLYECDYCSNVWDGFAQCRCWGFGTDSDSDSNKNVCTVFKKKKYL